MSDEEVLNELRYFYQRTPLNERMGKSIERVIEILEKKLES